MASMADEEAAFWLAEIVGVRRSVLAGLIPARAAWLIDGQVAVLAVDVGCSAGCREVQISTQGAGSCAITPDTK
jgi:hypothetical protein